MTAHFPYARVEAPRYREVQLTVNPEEVEAALFTSTSPVLVSGLKLFDRQRI